MRRLFINTFEGFVEVDDLKYKTPSYSLGIAEKGFFAKSAKSFLVSKNAPIRLYLDPFADYIEPTESVTIACNDALVEDVENGRRIVADGFKVYVTEQGGLRTITVLPEKLPYP